MKKVIYFLALMLISVCVTKAAYLTNVPCVRVQPNGDTLHCFASGDEFYHWLHDADGFTIIKNQETGYYVYADKVGDKLVPTAWIAGRTNPAATRLTPRLTISADQWRTRRQRWETATAQHATTASRTTNRDEHNHGIINNIVIFIRFADDTPFTNAPSDIENMFNDSTPGANSMYNYFKAASYNQLEIRSSFYPTRTGNTILSYQDSHTRSYFEVLSPSNPNGYDEDDDNERGRREQNLLARAVEAVADQIPSNINLDYNNDGNVDNVVFVIRGNVGDWSTLLWPHRWVLYHVNASINGLRVWDYNFQLADNAYYFSASTLCHEMNHSLGAPDLYHYYEGTDLSPAGSWDLMESNTTPPQHTTAWMKYNYGNWIDEIPVISECGTYTLHSVGSSATNNCYAIATQNPNEYILLEYRNQNDDFESAIPGSGILIYRINTAFHGNANYDGNTVFDELYIYRPFGTTTDNGNIRQANFSAQTARDAFHANTNPQPFLTDGSVINSNELGISNITEAGGDSISFTYCALEYLQVDPDMLWLNSAANTSDTFQIFSDMAWTLSCNCDWLSFSTTADSGSLPVIVTALSENQDFASRYCTVTITASNQTTQQIVIIQRGTEPYLIVESATQPLSFYHIDDTKTVNILTNSEWTATVDADWLSITPNEGNGDALLTLTVVAENNYCVDRFANLTISSSYGQSATVLLRQAHFAEGMLSVTPSTLSIGNEVGATTDCYVSATDSWEVTSKPIWLSVTPNQGIGSGNVTITTATANMAAEPRIGNVVFSDVCGNSVTLTITRDAGILTFTPTDIALAAAAGSTQTATITCNGAWQISPNSVPSWLNINPLSGNGDAQISITAGTENPDDSVRTALVIATAGTNLTDTLRITQVTASNLSEFAYEKIYIFPNPVDNQLTISAPASQYYIVYNVQSVEIQRGIVDEGLNVIAFAELPAGIYFIHFTDKNTLARCIFKMVKR